MKTSPEEVRSYFAEQANKRQTQGPAQRPANIDARLLKQAEVATVHLTGSAEWNVFLQRVQALIEESEQSLRSDQEAISSDALTNDEVQKLQRRLIATKAQIKAWEAVLSLPKEILERAAATPPKES